MEGSDFKEETFVFENLTLSYIKFGTGNNTLLCFHGFGQSKYYFKAIEKALGKEYTIFSFDLFFHGKSKWDFNLTILPKGLWRKIVEGFLLHQKIDKLSLMGFSMGGKFALSILESIPDRINKIVLIAPDGIKTSFWYSLATYPVWTSALFKKTVDNPAVFQKFAKVLKLLRLVDKGLVKFATTQMDTREKRERVYYSWMVFKEFKFDLGRVAELINDQGIVVEIFIGKYDKIITAKNMRKLLKKVKDYKMNILNSGHNHLITEVGHHYLSLKS